MYDTLMYIVINNIKDLSLKKNVIVKQPITVTLFYLKCSTNILFSFSTFIYLKQWCNITKWSYFSNHKIIE